MKLFLKKFLKIKLKIQYYDYLYYTLNSSIISDYQYDKLCFSLKSFKKKYKIKKSYLEYKNSLIKKNFSYFPEITHKTPMLSLFSGSQIEDFEQYEKKIKKFLNSSQNLEYFCDLKFDGLAISLVYEKGILLYAVTRGDGLVGENVTVNVMTISTIPIVLLNKNVPKFLEVRGEVYMKKKDFLLLNKQNYLKDKKNFSNPRNIAAGSLRHRDPEITRQRNLQFVAYSCNFFESVLNLENHDKNMFLLKKWGFPICKYFTICNTIKEVYKFYEKINNNRAKLNYEIDGIVIKINSKALQKKIGFVNKAPKWAFALKFFSYSVITKVIGIKFSIGRTGILTPVAFVKPIIISGVLIRKVSLYNKKKIEQLNLCLGDYVKIYRAGDVIPKIEKVLLEKRLITVQKIIFPNFCPVCKTKLIFIKKDSLIYCPASFFCSAQNEKRLLHFSSKQGVYIPGLGITLIKKLFLKGILKNPVDFFKLNKKSFLNISRIGSILTKKILNSIQKSKKVTLNKFIYSLGIFLVGKVVSQNLSDFFGSLNNFLKAKYKNLRQVEGVGKNIANSILLFLKLKENQKIILDLQNILFISSFFANSFYVKKFSMMWIYDKNFVLSGKFLIFSKKKIFKIIKNNGGNIKYDISKKINFLIIGEKYGNKFKKAKLLKIKILSEKQFIQKIKK